MADTAPGGAPAGASAEAPGGAPGGAPAAAPTPALAVVSDRAALEAQLVEVKSRFATLDAEYKALQRQLGSAPGGAPTEQRAAPHNGREKTSAQADSPAAVEERLALIEQRIAEAERGRLIEARRAAWTSRGGLNEADADMFASLLDGAKDDKGIALSYPQAIEQLKRTRPQVAVALFGPVRSSPGAAGPTRAGLASGATAYEQWVEGGYSPMEYAKNRVAIDSSKPRTR